METGAGADQEETVWEEWGRVSKMFEDRETWGLSGAKIEGGESILNAVWEARNELSKGEESEAKEK